VPVIAAIEGRAHVHQNMPLPSVIVAAEVRPSMTADFTGGIVPGTEFYAGVIRAGAGREEAFLLNPQPLTARPPMNGE